MTETQKEIIEIIEPFMDKSLNKWCLVQLWLLTEKKYRLQTILNSEERWLINYYTLINSDNQIAEKTYRDFIKVIWHYDITAVLKYINEYFEIRLNRTWKYFELYNWWEVIDYDNEELIIPNKPLHLYTEEENKNLLELLKQLWELTN